MTETAPRQKTVYHSEILPLTDRPEYAPVCAAWGYAEWGCQMPGRTLAGTIADYNARVNSPDIPQTWLAFCEGKIAGMASLDLEDHPGRPDISPWLASVFVHPSFRGKGLAKILCGFVEKQARDVYGYKTLYLYTHTAEKLYEALGWERIDTLADPMDLNPEGEALMIRHL